MWLTRIRRRRETLAVAQELYDGQDKKIITYSRAEVRYLPQSLIYVPGSWPDWGIRR